MRPRPLAGGAASRNLTRCKIAPRGLRAFFWYLPSILVRDRIGHAGHRRPGFPRVALPGEPWTAKFMATYEAAQTKEAPAGAHSAPGTITVLGLSYLGSAAFLALAPSTQAMRRYAVERFMKNYGPAEYGPLNIANLNRGDVEMMLDGYLTSKWGNSHPMPGAARNYLAMLRALIAHAMALGWRRDDPTEGIKLPKLRHGSGWLTWGEDEIAAYREHHPLGTMARLAFELLLGTAQRCADVVCMGWRNVRAGELTLRQSKTGATLVLPIAPELKAALDAMPKGNVVFLTLNGRPFAKPAYFTQWFIRRCREAGLQPGYSAHGLRKAMCRRLAETGVGANVIAAISGHKTLREVERYTRAADQARMARMGMEAVGAAFGQQNENFFCKPGTSVSKKG